MKTFFFHCTDIIIKYCRNIRSINFCAVSVKGIKTLSNNYNDISELIDAVGNLRNLEMLKVTDIDIGVVAEPFFNNISCNLQELKFLDVSSCKNTFDRDLRSISKLTKLEILKMEHLENITGSFLGVFPNLKKLYCKGCTYLENDFFIRILRSANKLDLLDISFCSNITNDVLSVAVHCKKRGS